ncbi:MAG: class I SAM-dependent methyltransferase [Azoarcus sp.]|jgi:SAM-dependent methyltransferase|nr:class I SAM-dependent methyltransferase [Azoarcus sp.]
MHSKNWFTQGGGAYARFRPTYPVELSAFLASKAPDTKLAVDAGCGSGQLTAQLGEHFDQVIGLDPSADQLANAAPHPRVRYECATAEKLPVQNGTVSLVTAAQAAHWFDLPAFFHEARRVAAPGAVVALVTYGALELEPQVNAVFRYFYREVIGRFWPAERALVDSGYAGMEFPFTEFPAPAISITRKWSLPELLGYVSTWSAARSAVEAGREDLLARFAEDMGKVWGDFTIKRSVIWPVALRIGRT